MRYFYTDPLAAAWMVKHHGLEITLGEPFIAQPLDTIIEHELGENETLPWFIHPDSMHLLEPREGDVLKAGLQAFGIIEKHGDRLSVINDVSAAPHFKFGVPAFSRIIQRNGIAFHWPEQEA